MSKKHCMIEVAPPDLTTYVKPVEVMVTDGYVCTNCHGEGWYWGLDETTHAPRKEPCLRCDSRGMLKAVVTVRWEPDYLHEKKTNL